MFPSTIPSDSVQTDHSIQMDTDENVTESGEWIQVIPNGKRRRILIYSVVTHSQILALSGLVTTKLSSTNCCCIYYPSTVKTDILNI